MLGQPPPSYEQDRKGRHGAFERCGENPASRQLCISRPLSEALNYNGPVALSPQEPTSGGMLELRKVEDHQFEPRIGREHGPAQVIVAASLFPSRNSRNGGAVVEEADRLAVLRFMVFDDQSQFGIISIHWE